MNKDLEIIELTKENIESMIYVIRNQKVMLDFDLAKIYGYETKAFNQQVQRNIEKFPDDFMFQITKEELDYLMAHNKTTSRKSMNKSKEYERSQIVTPGLWATGKGGRSYLPYAFTESGIYMLMTVLKGELAIKQSLALIRLFKQMKDYISSNALLGYNEVIKLTKKVEKQDRHMKRIDNKLDVVMDNFVNPSTYKHFLFLDGEKVEADIAYQTIYSLANYSIHIIDDYIDVKTFLLLRAARVNEITIISDNKAKNSLTKQFVDDLTNEYSLKLTLLKTNNRCHDRLIIIDYKKETEIVFVCGSSSKDAGNKTTTITRIDSGFLYHPLVDSLLLNEELNIS